MSLALYASVTALNMMGHLEESSGGTQQWGDIGELWEVGQLHSGSV